MSGRPVTFFFCGDVMLGRGVDQILPHPGDPRLREEYVRDARHYVELAELKNGSIPRPVGYTWPWGDTLGKLDDIGPDVRLMNLETSITRSSNFAGNKAVHYRMDPDNVPALTAGRPDVCVLANNHLMDFGLAGLAETLDTLARAGLRTSGAGRDAASARRPAEIPLGSGRRVLVFSFGMPSSGIPLEWAATEEHPGIDVVPEASAAEAERLVARIRQTAQPDDLVVASIHWGSNWGYRVARRQVRFAHRLIDGGVDIVHGHSSHHPRPFELHRGRLIMYGCGDFIDDYEGISGFEEYRDDLRLMYLASVDPHSGSLIALRILPLQARQLQLHRASSDDVAWVHTILNRIGRRFGTKVDLEQDGGIVLVR